jgi:hypothetical protein
MNDLLVNAMELKLPRVVYSPASTRRPLRANLRLPVRVSDTSHPRLAQLE